MAPTLTTGSTKMDTRFFGLGKPIEATTVQEALEQAKLNWTVSKRPILTTVKIPPHKEVGNPDLLTPNGTIRIEHLRYHLARFLKDPTDDDLQEEVAAILAETEASYIPHTDQFAIVRDDTNTPFGVLGRVYECLNNSECVAILEPLLTAGEVVIERGGHFNEGANCWIMARFPSVMSIEGEEIDQYMRLSWSHDGTEKLSATFVAYIRNTNTQISPSVPGARESIDIRHTINAKQRMEMAQQLLKKGASYFNALEDQLLKMLHTPLTNEEMETYLEVLMPDSAKAKSDGTVSRASAKRDEALDIFINKTHGPNTQYAGYTAIAQWCDHNKVARKGDEKRLQSTWTGSIRKMKDAAFKLIIK